MHIAIRNNGKNIVVLKSRGNIEGRFYHDKNIINRADKLMGSQRI